MNQSLHLALARAREHRLKAKQATVMSYETNDTVHREGDEATTLFTVRSGVAVATCVAADGEERALGVLTTGDVFGDEFPAEGVYLSTVTALTPLKLNAVGYDRLNAVDAAFLLLNQAERYRRMVEFVSRMATSSVKVRVCEVLSRLLASDLTEPTEDGMFTVKVSQQVLALLTHSRRETVARALQELKAEDVLVNGYTSVVVYDTLKLVEIAEGFGE